VATVKRLLCLANSRKLSGRCIAGREFIGGRPGAWIRVVSAREREEVSEYERQYEDGSDPRVLDIIEVPLLEPRPRGFQQENWLLDPSRYWVRVGRARWSELEMVVDPPEPLWLDGFHSFSVMNDRVPLDEAASLRSSLRLLRVPKLHLSVLASDEASGNSKRRVHGRFRHGAKEHQLWLTDPAYERAFLARADGEYALGECFLTISLGEAFNDACYKLIAAIIEPPPGRRP
jgi:hypothetical protein